MQEDTQVVLNQKNYDKDTQHLIETEFSDLAKRVTGYCTETGTTFITEPEVVATIMAKTSELLQQCKQLYIKYHENEIKVKTKPLTPSIVQISPGWKLIDDFESAITGSFMIESHYFLTELKLIQNKELVDIAVKHRLMDYTTEPEPWEETAKKSSG